eukprot:TRINITY_DN9971_c0_g1_i1.p1 TRINITY_DN9971_c0_g1~~TRINITY_DN9971_c0_g1_i1.p1  ORF type:complete len:106 (-),score=10.49 TRINITY_DN9971_c0_g1_i1:18-335(-)
MDQSETESSSLKEKINKWEALIQNSKPQDQEQFINPRVGIERRNSLNITSHYAPVSDPSFLSLRRSSLASRSNSSITREKDLQPTFKSASHATKTPVPYLSLIHI